MPGAITRAISIAAPPARVFAIVSDPTSMPRYAPRFARSVRPDGGIWIAVTSRGRLRLWRTGDAQAGTVDFRLKAQDGGENMVFTRVVPIGRESEFVFTLQLPDGVSDEAVVVQGAVLEEELQALKALCEAG